VTDSCDGAASSRWRPSEIAAGAALGCLALVTLVRSQGFDGVVFGGDEYAYLARALFPTALLERTDPLLQDLSNHGYLALIRLADAGPWRLQLIHLAGALVHGAGGVFTFLLARRFLDRLLSLLVGVLYFLLPTTGYVSSVMPEPVYAGVFALVAFLAVRRDAALRGHHAFGAGLAIGVLFSIKPHAIAVLVGACAYAGLAGLAGSASPPGLSRRAAFALSRVALVVAGFWTAAVLVAGALGGAWSASPRALVGGLYGDAVGSSVSTSFWAEGLPAVLRYAGGHLTVLLMLFGVPAAVLAAAAARAWRPRPEGAAERTQLAPGAFALLVLAAAVAMVSIFTAQVGAANAGEADRLHLRYYSFVLPLVMLAGIVVLRGARSDAAVRWGGVAMLAATAAFLVLAGGYKLYPWDAADVFALYDRTNAYWTWGRAPGGYREAALACVFAAGALVIGRPRSAVPALVATWAVVLALGNLSVYRWQRTHVRAVAPLYEEARAFSALVRSRGVGSGVVVGRDRYGTMSYVLAGLANAPHVRVVEASALTADVLPPEASWVVTVGDYSPALAYQSAVAGEHLTLYLRGRGGRPAVVPGGDGAVLDGRLEVSLAEGRPGADLLGFHPREAWGAWTAVPVASVVLERPLQGRYRVSLRAGTTAEHVETPLRIRLGEREYLVPLGVVQADHALEVEAPVPVDRLELHMPTASGAPWERRLGVAVGSLTLTRLP
jgi:phosphoglycerol transferase